jgi:superoxide reductase
MSEKNQTYKCNICGNVVELVYVGGWQLVCCGQPMQLLHPKSDDGNEEVALCEKHVPIIERINGAVRVRVGKNPHPMTKDHYIRWIELFYDGKVYQKYLEPGDAPEAEFKIEPGNFTARAYCNVHGLWTS